MSDSFLHFAGFFASYFLRVAAGYGICWLLSRLSPSPRRRFLVWLCFLLGAAGYWFIALVPAPVHVSLTAAVQRLPVHDGSIDGYTLSLPLAWAPALAVIARLMVGFYLLGISFFVVRMLWQHLSLRRALRQAAEPSRDLRLLFDQMCRGFGVRRCELLILPQLSSPATAGWVRPRILLPEICEDFHESAQLADVLYHELVHVSRRDYLWATVSDLVRCLLFFHPAVWRARQHMRVDRELACDVAVVSVRPEHCADYAQSLTRFARLRMLQPGRSMGIDFAASASILGLRVRAVLSGRPQNSWWRGGVRSILSVALVVSFGLVWPMFGIAAEFATLPDVVQVVPVTQSLAVHAPPQKRVPKRHRAAVPRPAVASLGFTLIVVPAATQAATSQQLPLSSSAAEPQPDDIPQPEDGPVADN